MRAIQIERYGGPEVLLHRDVPVPKPGPGELLVKMAHAGINFMDIHTREGKYEGSRTYPVTLPCTLGMEGAGTVAAVGDGVTGYAVGDRVAWCIVWGSYADYAVVPAWRAVKVPDALPLEMAAASVFHGFTAHYLAYDLGNLGPGRSCLIQAASGGIGQILVQLAKRQGARVFATTSTPEKAAVAKSRGADVAMPYEGFADRVRAETGGVGVDVVYDAVGKTTLRESFRAARRKGLIVNFGAVSGAVKDLDPIEIGEAGSLFLIRPRLADHLLDAAMIQRRADDIFGAILDGSLKITITGRYTLDDVNDAHEALEHRKIVGKPILDLQVTPPRQLALMP
jgi:NADPH2:quinone reductase